MVNLSKLQPLFPQPVDNLLRSLAQNRIQQAYLFHGPHLSDNTTLALTYSASLLCDSPSQGNHCRTCQNCQLLLGHKHPDFFHILPNEKGTITIDMVRTHMKKLFLSSAQAKRKVFLLEGADTMNASAQNAILKALEEPPANTHFLLSIKQPRRLLITVRSRCQSIHVNASRGTELKEWCTKQNLDEEVQSFITTLSANHIEQAERLKEQGIESIFQQLKECLQAKGKNIFHTIADLATSRESFLLCLSLLEVMVRDEVARRFGAKKDALYTESTLIDCNLEISTLQNLIAALQKLRAYNNIALNRPMALESVLLELSTAQSL